MNPIEWLHNREPRFGALDEGDRLAIMHFALIWTYFEARVCGRDANPNVLVSAAKRWHSEGKLSEATFAKQLGYFRRRYMENGVLTSRFHGLRIQPSRFRQLVEDVMKGDAVSHQDVASALLIIVYRLRNNLFHGEKWEYAITDQRANFQHAISILQLAVELTGA
jgi:hypothetical protein